MGSPLISFIIINYNTGKFLRNCVKSIENLVKDNNFEIIIIDNNSDDTSMDFNCITCKKIYLDKNIGFVKANNLSVDYSTGKYLYFLNPDTILLDGNVYNLINILKSNNDYGIVAPQVLNPDMSIQLTCRREPTLRRIFFYLFGLSKLFKFIPYFVDYKMEHEDYNNELTPDWVSGCGFIISKELFLKVGMFSKDYFMYWEDVTLCKEIRKLGYKIKYFPIHKILHYGGISSSKVNYFSKYMDVKSRFTYFKKYHSKTYLLFIKFLSYFNILLRAFYHLFMLKIENSLVYFKLLFNLK